MIAYFYVKQTPKNANKTALSATRYRVISFNSHTSYGKAVSTLYRITFCVDTKSYPAGLV